MERNYSPKRRKLAGDFRAAQTDAGEDLGPSLKPHQGKSRFQRPLDVNRSQSRRPKPRQEEFDGPEPGLFNDEDTAALDRDWYAGDEFGHIFGDESHNPFGGADVTWADKQREQAQLDKKLGKRLTAKAAQKQREVDAWEANRMLTSGVAQRRDQGKFAIS
jgi:pre-mRNA-splicing factor ATP-dependent RNA helicase DHX38/PRP16